MLKVLKFGGSSLADAQQFAKVKAIVEADESRRVVIVSAPGKRFSGDHKITDLLYLCAAHIKYGVSCEEIFDMIRTRYLEIAHDCGLKLDLNPDFDALWAKMQEGIEKDELASRGEYFSARLMAEYLGYEFLDAAEWVKFRFDGTLLKKMLHYSWPLLILGIAGILSQNMGQLIIPYLFRGNEAAAQSMVGIYGANIKIAIVMVMFTQAFRYAYEPFIFAQAKNDGESKLQSYADAMKFFVIFGLFIFLGVMYFLPVIKHFVAPAYWPGLEVVPVMMIAELCFGVFFNLSVWYKVTDRTEWGMYMSLICFVLMLGLNLWLVPVIGIPNGYIGSAFAALISYFAVMVISYFVGRKYYPIPYQTGRLALYTLLAAVLYIAGAYLQQVFAMWLVYMTRILMLIVYLGIVCTFEDVPKISPILRRLTHRNVK